MSLVRADSSDKCRHLTSPKCLWRTLEVPLKWQQCSTWWQLRTRCYIQSAASTTPIVIIVPNRDRKTGGGSMNHNSRNTRDMNFWLLGVPFQVLHLKNKKRYYCVWARNGRKKCHQLMIPMIKIWDEQGHLERPRFHVEFIQTCF